MKINPDNAVIAIVVFSFAFAGCGLTLANAASSDAARSEDDSRRPPPPTASDILEKDDANGNGVIDADEFPGPREHFAEFDADGNGSLSADEIEESLANRPPPPREGARSDRERR